jgi:outer membrane protein TolC
MVKLRIKTLVLSVATALLSACTVGPKYRQPQLAVPTSFAQAEQVKTTPVSWQSFAAFQSPVLDAVLARALEANTDIAGAQARLAEAKAYRGLTPYSLFQHA